tara:strand:- start:1858 stop:2121 length:264 start_codon:yes stop_codon:yes gene_type:complete
MTNAGYEKSNRKMRSDYKKETGRTLGKRHTTGKAKARVSFACRFAGMKGSMKKPNGEPTRKAIALKKWGFSSVEEARKFCNSNKEKK